MNTAHDTTSLANTGLRRAAALIDRPDHRALVIVEADASQRLLLAEKLPPGDDAAVRKILAQHEVHGLVRIVPASRLLCRTTPLPAVESQDPQAVFEALALLAEAELPASLPPHRRAFGLFTADAARSRSSGVGAGQPATAALLLGWPERPGDATPPPIQPDEVWTGEPAALLALMRAAGHLRIAAAATTGAGAISIVASGPARSLARVLRCNDADPASLQSELRAAIAETAAAAGIDDLPASAPARAGGAGSVVLLAAPNAPASRQLVTGFSADDPRLDDFALPLGAALAWLDRDPLVRSLVALHTDAPRSRQPVWARTLEWLSIPRHAAAVLAACVALWLLFPMAEASARKWILESRAGSADTIRTRVDEAERTQIFFEVLRDQRWPMTKLLADVSGAAPVGIQLESVELTHGQGLNIRGAADSVDLVRRFREQLAATRVFSAVATPVVDSAGARVQFQLEARVSAPLLATKPAEDFADKSLAQRLYGDGASNTAFNTSRNDSSASSSNAGASRDSRRASRPESSGSSIPRGSSATAVTPAADQIPPPLTNEQIAAMDWKTAMVEFTNRKRVAGIAGMDPATRERLLEESLRCQERMKAARAQGGS